MNKNKQVLKHCPNFYKIINFEYDEEDSITLKLIEIYRSFIFDVNVEDANEASLIEKFDFVLNKYIDDYFFRRDMKNRLLDIRVKKNSNDFMRNIVESIINAFDNYEMGYTRNIYFARWI